MPVTINAYDHFVEIFGDNTVDLDADVFKSELYNSSHIFTASDTARASVSANALATGNGYTNPGQNLSAVTWTHSGNVTTFDAANTSWTASGGSIGPADDAVVYDDTTTVPLDALAFSIDFGGSQTAGDGTPFTLTYDASGIFTVTG